MYMSVVEFVDVYVLVCGCACNVLVQVCVSV